MDLTEVIEDLTASASDSRENVPAGIHEIIKQASSHSGITFPQSLSFLDESLNHQKLLKFHKPTNNLYGKLPDEIQEVLSKANMYI